MSLLVVGSGSARQLLSWLEHYDEICKHPGDAHRFQPVDNYCLESYNLSTKYYDANLRVTAFDLDDSNAEVIKEETFKKEGLVIAVDASCLIECDQSSLLSLLALGESAGTSDSIAVRILLEMKASTNSEDTGSRNNLLEWSLDHSFEYIAIDPSRLAETCDSREKDGLPRLIEALQSTMWSTIVRKSVVIAAAALAPTHPESPASNTSDILDEFSDLIDKARHFHATANSGEIGDEERKRVAAETAMRFASLLGLDDDDDGDDA